MRQPRILDLFCGAGGCSSGYHRADLEVVGVDLVPQPRYPFDFIQADALDVLSNPFMLDQFDAFHASPPCGYYTRGQRLRNGQHPDLIAEVRRRLKRLGKPYVIENVVGAPLHATVLLCGTMFSGLKVYRHRLFETNFPVPQPDHPEHVHPTCKVGRKPAPGEWIELAGHFTGIDIARQATGLHWMTVRDMKEAIPPPYTEFIGAHMRKHLT